MRRALTLLLTPLFLVSTVLTGTAAADTTKAAYSWHIADQFLQDNVDSPPWAIAEADSGDLIKPYAELAITQFLATRPQA